jgi:hypothetical protein
MGSFIRRRALVQNLIDARQWARVTITVRTGRERLRVASKLLPEFHSYCDGTWTSEYTRETIATRPPKIEGLPDGGEPCDPEACESAIFSGIFFGRRQVQEKRLDVEILDAAGCASGDATGFAVAASAAVINAINPHAEFDSLGVGGWSVISVRAI